MSKTLGKSVKKVTKQFFSKSTIAIIILVGTIICVFVSLHPLNESLAQQFATALITVDGLILGFTILGVTVVIERGFSVPRITAIFEEHVNEFIHELKVVEISDVKKMKGKLASTVESALVDIISVPYVLFIAMYFLFASLLSAFMLFGVSDTTTSDPISVWAFNIVMGLSISFLIFGFHMTIRVLEDLTMKTNPKELYKAFEEAFNQIEQNLKGTTNTKKE
jgi:hypothetical protein